MDIKKLKFFITILIYNIIQVYFQEIYLFSIDNDGIDFKIDYEILSRTREIVKVPLIYGGGINNIEKIKKLIDIGFDGVTISTAIYDKSLDLIDVKEKLSKIYKKINFNTDVKNN